MWGGSGLWGWQFSLLKYAELFASSIQADLGRDQPNSDRLTPRFFIPEYEHKRNSGHGERHLRLVGASVNGIVVADLHPLYSGHSGSVRVSGENGLFHRFSPKNLRKSLGDRLLARGIAEVAI